MSGKKWYTFMLTLVFVLCLLSTATIHAAKSKVLVVMSYEETYPWCRDIKEGIDSVLGAVCEIEYFYMDTKKNLEGGKQKAEEAYALYKKIQPDGVITADDNAQHMFVVPYLKEKVKTPVMFCGVNAQPGKYGYPASNVSGILEREPIGESVALAKLLVPDVKTFGCIQKDSPTAQAVLQQIQSESDGYDVKFVDFKMPKTQKELMSMTEELKGKCDVLFTATMEGVKGAGGEAITDKEAIPILAKAFGKPLIGSNAYNVKFGLFCAVVKTGQEQGKTAAKMLLQAMKGDPVSKIPLTKNKSGRRIINVTLLKSLGIKARPDILRGSELVKTAK